MIYPNDYLAFITDHAGCRPNTRSRFDYDGTIEGPTADEISIFCHFDDGPYAFSVEEEHSLAEEYSIEKVIPFAFTEVADLLCFDFRKDDARPDIVIMMLHFSDDPDEILSHISDTFTEFVEMLYRKPDR